MSDLWQTIIGGLTVAAITGLSVIAYRHPAAYARVYRQLVWVVIGVWAMWFIYDLGFTSGFSNAVLATMKLNSGAIINTPNQKSTSFWFYMVPVIVSTYLTLLSILPSILRENGRNPEGGGDDA